MTWSCGAIDHAITIYPDGTISPCCQTSADYRKPISKLNDPDRFHDLKTETPPTACSKCVNNERQELTSYRKFFEQFDNGLQYVDIRNTNECNLKCRYCGPHFSNQWAREMELELETVYTNIDDYLDDLLTEDLDQLYFTGGEPFISRDHWNILQRLVNDNKSKSVSLRYNSNLTTLKFKQLDIFDLWSKFKFVEVQASIDQKGVLFENIRSGAKWNTIEKNLFNLKEKVYVTVSVVISILNIWNLFEFLEYLRDNKISYSTVILKGPDYLSIECVPPKLEKLALESIDKLSGLLDNNVIVALRSMIGSREDAESMFQHTLNHILLLDNLRNENLFSLLPFEKYAKKLILNNNG
jgi:uncharacterized Fe-S cluster-containing radical SAM superfamily protein